MTTDRTSKNDVHSWENRMHRVYGDLSETQPMFYWDGVMTEEDKKKRQLTWEQLDEMAGGLLKDGYRIIKCSAISPKGVYSLYSRGEPTPPNASNLFFELEFNEEEFKRIYDFLGRYQNNFPDYLKKPGDYEEYKRSHDLWILEDIKTHGPTHPIPVGFATFCFDDSKEGREEFHVPEGQRLLYHDTVVIDPGIQGKHVGMRFMNITDGYYLRHFGTDGICYGLCTGQINTTDKGTLSLKFHEERGFRNWFKYSAPYSKWTSRYRAIEGTCPPSPVFMIESYLGKVK